MYGSYSLWVIIRAIKKENDIYADHVAIIRQKRKNTEGFEGKPEENRSLEISRSRRKVHIEIDYKIEGWLKVHFLLIMLARG